MRRIWKTTRLSVSLASLVICATVSYSQEGAGYKISIIDGVSTRIYESGYSPAIDPYLVVKDYIIGADQGEETYLLTSTRPAAISDDGTLYIIDATEAMVYVFSQDGTLHNRFGGLGQGPGEFTAGLGDLILDESLLYCPDRMGNRLMILTEDGDFVRILRADSREAMGGTFSLFDERDSRKYLTFGMVFDISGNNSTYRLSRWTESFVYMDSPLEIPVTESPVRMRGVAYVPFTSKAPISVSKSDAPFAWYAGDQPRIEFISPVSLERWAVTIPHETITFSAGMKRRWVEIYSDLFGPEVMREIRFPGNLPHFKYLFWDSSNRLWAQEHSDPWAERDNVKFYVFSAEGEWLFIQHVPLPAMYPMMTLFSEDGFYYTGHLDDGTPIIQFYRMTEKTPETRESP